MTSWWDIWGLPKAKPEVKSKIEPTGYFDGGTDTYIMEGNMNTSAFYSYGPDFFIDSNSISTFYEC